MICIYKITNLKNGKVYIGSTHNFQLRKQNHFSAIKNKCHHNKRIKSDSLIYELPDFDIIPLTTFNNISVLWLRYLEAIWIDYFKYHYDLYNINLNTTGFGIQMLSFPTRKEKLEFRKVAKIEKRKANEFVLITINNRPTTSIYIESPF